MKVFAVLRRDGHGHDDLIVLRAFREQAEAYVADQQGRGDPWLSWRIAEHDMPLPKTLSWDSANPPGAEWIREFFSVTEVTP